MAEHIFISYRRRDARHVNWVRDSLLHAGYRCFIDTHMQGSIRWQQELDSKIDTASALVVVWTHNSLGSLPVQAEVRRALAHGIPLLQVRLAEVEPPEEFAALNVVDLAEWAGNTNDANWLKVLNFLASHGVPRPGVKARQLPASLRARARSSTSATLGQQYDADWEAQHTRRQTIRAHNSEQFHRHVEELVRARYHLHLKGEGVAELRRDYPFHWYYYALSAPFLFLTLPLFKKLYARSPKREIITVVLQARDDI